MELEFTSEQEELRSSVRSFLDKECPLELVRAVVETGEAPEDLWASMVALDWPALAVPEDNDGLGLSFVETAVVAEELGRVIAPGPLLPTVTQFAPMVREVGTPEQRQRFLSLVASGAITGTVALADHPRGWALDAVTMTAERAEGGWVLDGTKLGILGDAGMGEVAVVARAGDGVGAFVVPAGEAGLATLRSLDASRPLSTATLDRVLVPDDRALGEPGSAASTLGVSPRPPGGDRRARTRDRRYLRRAVPDGPDLREGPQAVRGAHRVLPGGQAQDEQHVPRHRARPFPLLLRGRRHRRGHAGPCHRRLHGQGRQ